MFGSPKRHTFKPTAYGTTRRQRRIPRWLVLMLTGVVLGAGGLLFLQKSYGPVRLTVEQSEQLHYDLNSVNMDRQRLQSELNRQNRELTDIRTQLNERTEALTKAQAKIKTLETDVAMFAAAMPDDPRGSSPGVRAASFVAENDALNYRILVMQEEGKTDLFTGQVQLVVAGRYANRKSGHIDLPKFDISLERYTHAEGTAALPEGFSPRQVTIQIMPPDSDKVVATRTIRVSK